MGVIDVPQWLPGAFVRSVLAVGATAPRAEIEATCRRLLDRWQESDRHFHNLRHLVDVLARVDELAEETHHPDIVRIAAWYHGAVFSSVARKAYSRSGGEDEVASAELAVAELGALGVPERVTARIAELILNLKRHEASRKDIDCLALCDADLAVLASEPQKYQAYRKAVRAEYDHIPPRHYVEARTAIVTKLLNRRDIFVSPMGAQWEDAARENLSAELDRLRAEHVRLGEAGPEESVAAAEAALGEITEDGLRAHDGDSSAPHSFHPAQSGVVPTAGPAVRAPSPSVTPAGTTADEAVQEADKPARGTVAHGEGMPSTVTSDDEAADGLATAEHPSPTSEGDHRAARAGRSTSRPSSLEALPDELETPRRPSTDGAPGREAIARSSRERIEAAVRHGQERAERERRQRDRLATARAERAEALAPLRERRARQDTSSARTAATPLSAPSSGTPSQAITASSPAEAPQNHVAPEHRPAVDDVPQMIEPEPLTGERARVEEAPLHGIEREPDLFDRPRRKERKPDRKDRKDRKKGRAER